MSLELLTISGYTNKTFQKTVSENPYQLIINPDTLNWSRILTPNIENPISKKESHDTSLVNLKFDIVIDCTGIVDPKRTNLIEEIKSLEAQLYVNADEDYTPNYVKVEWGKEICFFSQLKSCDIDYTLFKPDGTPVRAKVSFVFGKQNPAKKATKNKSKGWFGFLRKF